MSPMRSVHVEHALSLVDKHAKKQRHRHSQVQLAALNDLYEKTKHPSLEDRTSLAESLGMETKTVNAWFQNKRASLKKRSRGAGAATGHGTPRTNVSSTILTPASASSPSTPHHHDVDEPPEDDDPHMQMSLPMSVDAMNPSLQPSFFAGNIEHQHFGVESETLMPRRNRLRPSPEQAEKLKKMYDLNPHPTREEREELGARIGMRYQSITNWFQNQRSLAKKRREDEAGPSPLEAPRHPNTSIIEFSHRSTFPTQSLVLTLPPPAPHPSIAASTRSRRSPSLSAPSPVAFSDLPLTSRRSTPRRSSTPYRGAAVGTTLSRPRRTRPDAYQLEALRGLFSRTSNPTIEERSMLAVEIGMDVGKVTNWFRNLRQTSRKRAKKSTGAHDHDYDEDDGLSVSNLQSTSGSRHGTQSLPSSSSSSANGDHMDVEGDGDEEDDADAGSEEDYQEAVTPLESSPSTSPRPYPLSTSAVPTTMGHAYMGVNLDPAAYATFDKSAFPGVRIEDALLLLRFAMH